MIFNNYCAVFVVDVDGVDRDVMSISEKPPRFLGGPDVVIATFISPMSGDELTDYFQGCERSFMLFDINQSGSGYYFQNDHFMDELFNNMFKDNDKSELKNMSNQFMNNVGVKTRDVSDAIVMTDDDCDEDIFDQIKEMGKREKNDIVNDILKNGGRDLSDYDKRLLRALTE